MTDKHLYIATPTYSDEVGACTAQSVLNALGPIAEMGWLVSVMVRSGDADLGRARNALAAEFLASPCSHMLFLDGDISFAPEALCQLLRWDADLDVVAGAYHQRADHGTFPVRWDMKSSEVWCRDPATSDPSDTGLIEVEGVPAGFVRISRHCLERMSAAYADRWYGDDSISTKRAVGLFEFSIRNNERYSEDINFCLMWRDIGGKVYMDPNISLNHHGRKAWSQNVGTWLRGRDAPAEASTPISQPGASFAIDPARVAAIEEASRELEKSLAALAGMGEALRGAA